MNRHSVPPGNDRHPADGGEASVPPRARVALITPYTGGNLGDAAIQDALIANVRARVPGVQFSGICLNVENFTTRHAADAFPLCATPRPYYGMSRGSVSTSSDAHHEPTRETSPRRTTLVGLLKRVPGVRAAARAARAAKTWALFPIREVRHCVRGYRYLAAHDLAIVAGGGQLDDEWGGPWGHPFNLFKWAVLSRLANVPLAVVSVGACKLRSRVSRFFLRFVLRTARYVSYREEKTRALIARELGCEVTAAVVPDLAFSLPPSLLPATAGVRAKAGGRRIVAVSPIAYAKPGRWPFEDAALHERYIRELARAVTRLLESDCFVVVVWSSLGDDESVIKHIVERLEPEALGRLDQQWHVPRIRSWSDLVGVLRDADCLIASRLHSVILGFVSRTPAVALSFDPKVDWVMEDVGQTRYLFDITRFTAEDILGAVHEQRSTGGETRAQIDAYFDGSRMAMDAQFARVAGLVRLAGVTAAGAHHTSMAPLAQAGDSGTTRIETAETGVRHLDAAR
jgi:polysaccharide pyruvyl transferase WcaK-like protein